MIKRTPSAKRLAASPARSSAPQLKKPTPEKKTPRRCTKADEKENSLIDSEVTTRINRVTIQDDEAGQYEDESSTIARSAIEAYFMQGRTAGEMMNKSRVKRGRRKIVADKNLEEEAEENEEVDGRFLQVDLRAVRDFIKDRNSSKTIQNRIEKIVESFPKWTLYLAANFSLLLHGVGSKKEILSRFAKQELSGTTHMRLDATREDVGFRAFLTAVNDNMKLGCSGRGLTVNEWAHALARQIFKTSRQLILLIDNLDSPRWRNDQTALCSLLEYPRNVKLIATVDNINTTIIWNSRHLDVFNFLHIRCDTLALPLEELMTSDSKILGLDGKSNNTTHSISSLDVFWKSLASNSQRIFHLFFEMFLQTQKPVNFWELFSAAKDEFCVSTDTALRTQLVEFKDHRIIKWSRSEDGNDQLSGIVDRDLISQFLTSKGMPLSVA
ncbi:unnamed protein product [Caenorhabditis auriculariae]|uniref:Origin recognition complex subunit 2 n=1 Tax=Caenorhabditis auriculariae TaxID=2777116 RepID=A0A8S1HIP9_9PELO|nr:unnamed protein product [Caenorhabditis auriculariae]